MLLQQAKLAEEDDFPRKRDEARRDRGGREEEEDDEDEMYDGNLLDQLNKGMQVDSDNEGMQQQQQNYFSCMPLLEFAMSDIKKLDSAREFLNGTAEVETKGGVALNLQQLSEAHSVEDSDDDINQREFVDGK